MAYLYLTAKTVPSGTPLPTSAQALANFIAQYESVDGLSTINGINAGYPTPAAGDRDKPWNRLDVDGFSLGWWNYVDGSWKPETPIGQITWFGHLITTAPVGYKLLNGVGNYTDEAGVSHPVPNWIDRVPVGSGNTYAPLDTGGDDSVSASLTLPSTTESHTLTVNQIPPHDHRSPTEGPTTVIGEYGLEFNQRPPFSSPQSVNTAETGGGAGHSHPISGNATGTIDIRQKYIAAPALIWVAS